MYSRTALPIVGVPTSAPKSEMAVLGCSAGLLSVVLVATALHLYLFGGLQAEVAGATGGDELDDL
jgi:hypothetical protein